MMLNIFHMLICYLYILFGNMPVQVFAHLWNWSFSYCWILRVIYIFWIEAIYMAQIYNIQIFSPSLWLVFIVFYRTKFFNVSVKFYINLIFMYYAFGHLIFKSHFYSLKSSLCLIFYLLIARLNSECNSPIGREYL